MGKIQNFTIVLSVLLIVNGILMTIVFSQISWHIILHKYGKCVSDDMFLQKHTTEEEDDFHTQLLNVTELTETTKTDSTQSRRRAKTARKQGIKKHTEETTEGGTEKDTEEDTEKDTEEDTEKDTAKNTEEDTEKETQKSISTTTIQPSPKEYKASSIELVTNVKIQPQRFQTRPILMTTKEVTNVRIKPQTTQVQPILVENTIPQLSDYINREKREIRNVCMKPDLN